MRFWLGACTLFMLAALFGCQGAQTLGGTPAPKTYRKIVSLSPGTTELILSFGQMDVVKGRTESCDFPESAKQIPIVASVKPNYEKLAAIKPDLVLYDATLTSEDDLEKVKQIGGVDVFGMEVHSLNEFIDWLYRFGTKTGTETMISEYVDKLQVARERAIATASKPAAKVAVLLGDPTSGYMIAGKNSFVADIVRASGAEAVGPEDKIFVPMNVEALLALDPDVIFTGGDAAKILQDPRLKTIKAVKNRKVARVNPDVLLRAGSRVDQLIRALFVFVQSGQ